LPGLTRILSVKLFIGLDTPIKMKKLILLLLFPVLCQAQFIEENYVFVSTGVDIRNAFFGSDVNEPAYNGRFSLGYRNAQFQVQGTYETFSAIGYQAGQIAVGPAFNIARPWQFVTLVGGGMAKRTGNWMSQQYHIAFFGEGHIEYHFNNRFVAKTILEAKYRGELERTVVSGFFAIQLKF